MGKLLFCRCGDLIADRNIGWITGKNEYGVRYTEIRATCVKCEQTFETACWGELYSLEEAKQTLAGWSAENNQGLLLSVES